MIIEYFIKPTDLSKKEFKEQLTLYNWDLVIRNRQYNVYSMHKCYHCQGGTGDNNLWCIERDKDIIPENFQPYEGDIINDIWGVQITPKPHFRKNGVQSNFECCITRNKIPFYEIHGNNFSYLYNQSIYVIQKLNDFVVPFHFRNWKTEIVDRKIWWRERYPAIITRWIQPRGCIVIIPDDKEMVKSFDTHQQKEFIETESVHFPATRWEKEDFGRDFSEEREVLLDLFDPNINWFRGD